MLNNEYQYFKNNLSSLLKEYKGKFLVIKDSTVIGNFNSYKEALDFALSKFKVGQFLIQECVDEDLTTAQFFNSYVVVNESTS